MSEPQTMQKINLFDIEIYPEDLNFIYKKGKIIGSGAYGVVCLYQTKDGKKAAAKFENPQHQSQVLTIEAKIMKDIINSGVKCVPAYIAHGVKKWKDYDFGFLIMDYIEQSVEEYIEKMPNKDDDNYNQLFVKMVDAIQQIHQANHVHRDLKPENIRIQNEQVYIIDFGQSKKFIDKGVWSISRSKGKQARGTPLFLSLNVHGTFEQSRLDDLISLAYSMLYLSLGGKLPWSQVEVDDKDGTMTNQMIQKQQMEQIKQKKEQLSESDFTNNRDKRLITLIKYLNEKNQDDKGFYDEPDYNYIKQLITSYPSPQTSNVKGLNNLTFTHSVLHQEIEIINGKYDNKSSNKEKEVDGFQVIEDPKKLSQHQISLEKMTIKEREQPLLQYQRSMIQLSLSMQKVTPVQQELQVQPVYQDTISSDIIKQKDEQIRLLQQQVYQYQEDKRNLQAELEKKPQMELQHQNVIDIQPDFSSSDGSCESITDKGSPQAPLESINPQEHPFNKFQKDKSQRTEIEIRCGEYLYNGILRNEELCDEQKLHILEIFTISKQKSYLNQIDKSIKLIEEQYKKIIEQFGLTSKVIIQNIFQQRYSSDHQCIEYEQNQNNFRYFYQTFNDVNDMKDYLIQVKQDLTQFAKVSCEPLDELIARFNKYHTITHYFEYILPREYEDFSRIFEQSYKVLEERLQQTKILLDQQQQQSQNLKNSQYSQSSQNPTAPLRVKNLSQQSLQGIQQPQSLTMNNNAQYVLINHVNKTDKPNGAIIQEPIKQHFFQDLRESINLNSKDVQSIKHYITRNHENIKSFDVYVNTIGDYPHEHKRQQMQPCNGQYISSSVKVAENRFYYEILYTLFGQNKEIKIYYKRGKYYFNKEELIRMLQNPK